MSGYFYSVKVKLVSETMQVVIGLLAYFEQSIFINVADDNT